jgi:hypothetical protein
MRSFGGRWYDTLDNAVGYAMHSSRSHDANEAVAEQIFKALETLHKAREQLQYDLNEIRKSD